MDCTSTVQDDTEVLCKSARCVLKLEDLPVDVIILILKHLHLEDVVVFGRASKFCQSLLKYGTLWRHLYRTARLPLPPGPFVWQTNAYLSETLITSGKVQSNWPIKQGVPQVTGLWRVPIQHQDCFCLLLHRWILVGRGSLVLCYDLHISDPGASSQVLHQEDEGARIEHIWSAWDRYADGRVAAFVVICTMSGAGRYWKLLRIPMDSGSPSQMEPVLEKAYPAMSPHVKPYIALSMGNRILTVMAGAFLWTWEKPQEVVVMDFETLQRYHHPSFTFDAIAYTTVGKYTCFFSTQTHFIKLTNVVSSGIEFPAHSVFECFPIPPRSTTASEVIELQRSHQGRVAEAGLQRPFVIYESSPDPLYPDRAGFILAGLAWDEYHTRHSTLSTIDVHLEDSCTISCTRTDIFHTPHAAKLEMDCSNGHARGIYDIKGRPEFVAFQFCHEPDEDEDGGFLAFSWSQPVLVPEVNARRGAWQLVTFDGFGGRVFYDVTGMNGRTVQMMEFASTVRQTRLVAAGDGRMRVCKPLGA